MHWISGFFNTLILLGALQGFIVSALLYHAARTKSPGTASRQLLATLIFLLALACLNVFLYKQPWTTSTTAGAVFAALVPMIIIMPVGPLIFFYIRSCIDPAFHLERKHRIHFYPIIVDLFPHLFALIYIIGLLTHLIPQNVYNFGGFIDDYNAWSDVPRWLSLVIYLCLSVRMLNAAKKAGKQISWPKKFVRIFIIFGSIWLLFLLPYEIPRYSNALIDTLDWYPIYLPLVFMIYWLGVKGYFLSHQETMSATSSAKTSESSNTELSITKTLIPGSSSVKSSESPSTEPPIIQTLIAESLSAKSSTPQLLTSYTPSHQTFPNTHPGKTSKPPFPEPAANAIILTLKKCMEEDRIWMDPELNLHLLAQHSKIASKTISTVLNQHMNKTFNEFINEYRITEVQKRLALPESRTLTIAGLAYECGFNSLPTFQRAFKTILGLSPKAYLSRQNLQNK